MGDKTETLRKKLSANIKKHREQLGITQEKLAEAAGIFNWVHRRCTKVPLLIN